MTRQLQDLPWLDLQPLEADLFSDLSIGIMDFCHDASNALSAAFAANDLALEATADEKQRKRLNRTGRQLTQLQTQVHQARAVAWRPNTIELTVGQLTTELRSAASRRNVTLSWGGERQPRQLYDLLGGVRARHIGVILITVANGLHIASQSESVELQLSVVVGSQTSTLAVTARNKQPKHTPQALPTGHLGMGLTSIATVADEVGGAVKWRERLPDFDLCVDLPTPDERLS